MRPAANPHLVVLAYRLRILHLESFPGPLDVDYGVEAPDGTRLAVRYISRGRGDWAVHVSAAPSGGSPVDAPSRRVHGQGATLYEHAVNRRAAIDALLTEEVAQLAYAAAVRRIEAEAVRRAGGVPAAP